MVAFKDTLFVDNSVVPIQDKSIKKYRELSESLWEIQQFDPSGPFREAECIPLVTPSSEITENATYQKHITAGADAVFQKLLENLELALSQAAIHSDILRCVLIRVKKGCKIYPHIDTTFPDLNVIIYRMQLVSSSKEPFVRTLTKKGKELYYSPEIGILDRIPTEALQAEENIGLNDNIHLLVYTQPSTGHEALKIVSGQK
jgi:hypothetical protein